MSRIRFRHPIKRLCDLGWLCLGLLWIVFIANCEAAAEVAGMESCSAEPVIPGATPPSDPYDDVRQSSPRISTTRKAQLLISGGTNGESQGVPDQLMSRACV